MKKLFMKVVGGLAAMILSALAILYVATTKPTKKGLRNAAIITFLTIVVKDALPYLDEIICISLMFKKYFEYRGVQAAVKEGIKEHIDKQEQNTGQSATENINSEGQLTWSKQESIK